MSDIASKRRQLGVDKTALAMAETATDDRLDPATRLLTDYFRVIVRQNDLIIALLESETREPEGGARRQGKADRPPAGADGEAVEPRRRPSPGQSPASASARPQRPARSAEQPRRS